jgi:2,4-dienoyl-CoA reductase (NADPH2)
MLHQAEKAEELYRLLTQGSKRITVAGMGSGVGKDIGPSTRWSMLAMLKKFHVKIVDQAKVASIKKEGVLVETPEGRNFIPADTVVLALGTCPNNELYDALRGKVEKLSVIGDANRPRKMQMAIREAYNEAIQ